MENVPEPRERATEPIATDADRYVSYDDGDATVICDRRDATAWIRSSVVVPLER